MSGYFTPDALKFLRDLRAHNERDWFLANKERYEGGLREPFLRLIADLEPVLRKISPRIVVDARPVGGSMMRIYRDVRFAKDKSPYKTAVAAHFWHRDGKEGAMPAFYLHLEPGRCAVGGGIWRPEPAALKMIREAIATEGKRWQKATAGGKSGFTCGMIGESLKRPPPGFAADHPFIEDLKRKDFAISASFADGKVSSSALLDTVASGFRATTPFLSFLSEAVGLSF